MDAHYFSQIYECIYEQYARLYSARERQKHLLIRVDSTLVSDTAGKLQSSIGHTSGKKAVKYTMAFDRVLPCSAQAFSGRSYNSEAVALPHLVWQHVRQEAGHQNLYVLDRGLQSGKSLEAFAGQQVPFVCRLKEKRKYELRANLLGEDQRTDLGEGVLVSDELVWLYCGERIQNKKGNVHYRESLLEQDLRLLIVESKQDPGQRYWLLTNALQLSAEEVARAYRQRWDMEVFFRFLKQELHLSHLVSLNQNGIQVMLYMTLIVAMLLLIYKHANAIGYKTAKRRFAMEVRNLAIAIIVAACGGTWTNSSKHKKVVGIFSDHSWYKTRLFCCYTCCLVISSW
ncbi:transposase [Pontibacter sp. HSC-14F20]|uniref:transposase n=1 Tax=Pontibacter sp. HSC-14F20 TaxID=2864136 RepID=UPI00351D39C9